MCTSKPKVQKTELPVENPTPPAPEPVAETPKVNEGAKRTAKSSGNRKGTSSLRIDLGMNLGQSSGGNGLTIPTS